MSYSRYCRYRCMLKRLENCEDKWLRYALVTAIGGYAASRENNRVYFCRDTFEHADLDDFELRCDHLAPNLKGRPRKRKVSSKKDNPNDSSDESNCSSSFSSQTDHATSATNKVRTGARATPLRNGFRIDRGKASKDEQVFLDDLKRFMKNRNTPIGRIPSLGFKQIDLFQFYTLAEEIGGYEQISNKRMWKHLYDKLGGNPGFTSAATCTRRHYEKLLLPYERYKNGQDGRDGHPSHQHLVKKKKHRVENQSGTSCKEPVRQNSEEAIKSENKSIPVTSSSGSALPLPVSNGNQSMMSKDIASLTDKALIIKQEIEKMKMRKDAKKQMKKEVHVDHKSMLPDPSNIVTNVGKDDKKPTACEPKVSAVTPIDIRRRKWVEKGRRPSGGQKTVRELLHQNGQDPKESNIPLSEKDQKNENEGRRSHAGVGSIHLKTETPDAKMPNTLPGISSPSVSNPHSQPLLPNFNPARPMFYPQLVPVPQMLPLMIPHFGLQPLGSQVQPMQPVGNPVKDEKPLHALDKLVTSHNDSLGNKSAIHHPHHRHKSPRTVSPPSAHSASHQSKFLSPPSSSMLLKSDHTPRPITPAHSNNIKREYPYQETNRNSHVYPADIKCDAHMDKDLKRQKKIGSQSMYSPGELEVPVLDLSMKTMKAEEARQQRGESLLFDASFNRDTKFPPKKEHLDVPQDLSVKSKGSSSSSVHKAVPLNVPLPMHSVAGLGPGKKDATKNERTAMISQAGSQLFPNTIASIGGLPIDLASFVHPAFPQQMLMQGFPHPLQIQKMIQGQVATGMPFLRPELVQSPLLFPPTMSSVAPPMFSPGAPSGMKSGASHCSPTKR